MTDLLTTCPGRGPETALKEGRERIGLEMTSLIQLNYFFVKKRIYFGAIGRLKLFSGLSALFPSVWTPRRKEIVFSGSVLTERAY